MVEDGPGCDFEGDLQRDLHAPGLLLREVEGRLERRLVDAEVETGLLPELGGEFGKPLEVVGSRLRRSGREGVGRHFEAGLDEHVETLGIAPGLLDRLQAVALPVVALEIDDVGDGSCLPRS